MSRRIQVRLRAESMSSSTTSTRRRTAARCGALSSCSEMAAGLGFLLARDVRTIAARRQVSENGNKPPSGSDRATRASTVLLSGFWLLQAPDSQPVDEAEVPFVALVRLHDLDAPEALERLRGRGDDLEVAQ